MNGPLLLVRHARAAGQAPDAPLTAQGELGAAQLAQALAHRGVTRIVSSPWTRAVETARPLAERLGLKIETDERLTERVLSGVNLADWRTHLRASFADPALALPGGESGQVARARILAALEEASDRSGLTVVLTHGNLMALALGLDFEGWAALGNPDVRRLEPSGRAERLEVYP
ncbi:histidine phosphatase family protein [Deinococcus hopiensis]|uniref:2,3-bisphosphoglycerate-dependent phosphoglycerate mutase n=1 Tax=Deinococcus hopiensis KR-140 TaxID=695939 RepID=A0A1W1VDK5_9DEIO|nr:histidine phosphatase family protein [Deinococcus hopiensis]SMB91462.1 2,3-bisphosphoglycerate-dependent phosphoglycerate mutase [Deinococcus hopiensis KR-140]